MIQALIAAAAAIATTLIAGGMITSRTTQLRRQLADEIELLKAAPEGSDARRALEAHAADSVREYRILVELERRRRREFPYTKAAAFLSLLLVFQLVLLTWKPFDLLDAEGDGTIEIATPAGVAVLTVAGLIVAVLVARVVTVGLDIRRAARASAP